MAVLNETEDYRTPAIGSWLLALGLCFLGFSFPGSIGFKLLIYQFTHLPIPPYPFRSFAAAFSCNLQALEIINHGGIAPVGGADDFAPDLSGGVNDEGLRL